MWKTFERSITRPLRALLAYGAERLAEWRDPRDWSYERLTYDVLRAQRTLDLATLIDRVATEAMHATQRGGGAHLDIAVWGPSVFHCEANAAVRRMIGRTLVLEADGPGILVAPITRAPCYALPTTRAQRAVGLS